LLTSTIDSVVADKPAFIAGVQKGDRITAINSVPVKYNVDVVAEVKKHKGEELVFTVNRAGQNLNLNLPADTSGLVGIAFNVNEIKIETIQYGLMQALPIGVKQAWVQFSTNAKGIVKVVTGKVEATKAFSGPVEIARKVYGGEWIWARFWASTAFISIALAFMNLLPIPALDGGHVVFLLIEMVKGKPLGDKFMERAQMVGFVLLLTLMVFVLGNDIFKAFTK